MIPISSASGMKLPGKQEPVLTPVPARERLQRDEPPRPEIHDRLEVNVDLAALDRALERRRQLLATPNLGVHLGT